MRRCSPWYPSLITVRAQPEKLASEKALALRAKLLSIKPEGVPKHERILRRAGASGDAKAQP